jgi:muconate cycloisomerase
MKVTGVEVLVVELPRRWPYRWRSLESSIGRYAIVQVSTDAGLTGLGEAPVLPDWGGEHGRYYGEDTTIVAHLVRQYFAPVLIGADPLAARALGARMDEVVRGFPYTKAMLESALLDLAGRALGVPVYELLGGALRREIPICHSVGLAPPEDAAREAAGAAADGIRSLQVKVAGDPARDVAVMRAVRKAVGDAVRIYPDVNRGYRSAKEAAAAIEAMRAEAGICMVEQPVEGAELMAQVAAAVDVPVMADEGCWTPEDAIEIVRRRSADAISIYYTKSGGLRRSAEIGAIAGAAGLPVNVNGSLEAGVGNAANLHLAAALGGTVLPAVITVTTLAGREQTRVGGVFYTDDVIAEPFAYRDGCLAVPGGPGLGVELDPAKVARYRVA